MCDTKTEFKSIQNVLERSSTTSPSLGLDSVATMSAFNHVYNIKEYFYISPVENQNKVCPAHNNVNNVRINKVGMVYILLRKC